MHPILLKIGPITIYSYGVMVALGFTVSVILICKHAAGFNLDKDKMLDLAVIILLAGIIGARILYVALNLKVYMADPIEILKLSRGGLVWYGGFLSALFAAVFYIRKKGMDFWNVVDLIAPYTALAQAFGRIGCFLNGCCYGIDGLPAQIYSSILLFLIFVILRLWQKRRRFAGEIFLGYCLLYCLKRFVIEFIRGDNPRIFLGLTISQIVSFVVFLAAAVLFTQKAIRWKKDRSGSK